MADINSMTLIKLSLRGEDVSDCAEHLRAAVNLLLGDACLRGQLRCQG